MTQRLPTGVVTFMLTDVEGSTRAWQSERAGLADAIQRHYELLDSWVVRHGGARPEEQGEGDSVVAVFPDPVAAVMAAIGAQRELLGELPDLPVRMALHTGPAHLRDERNYVGLTVIRCARIRSCGHGSQILVSSTTAEAVDGRWPSGCSVRVLGDYGLKGLSGRTRIAQVVGPDLPDTFPPLRAGASASGNLPHRLSSFVGRRNELAELTALIGEHRLVSVVGETGVGKSRLALAAAAAVADAHPGGAWWVSLADLTDASIDDVAASVAAACSVDREGAPFDDVVRFFGSVAHALLVLDGVDGARSSATGFTDRLLARCPEVVVVATGCEPLAVGGESTVRLAAYPTPVASDLAGLAATAAGELFLARLADAGGTATDGEVDAIVRICERWPAAADVEMAAIRAASASPRELLAELDELGGQASAVLASSLHWHLRSLGDRERTVLRRLSIFRRSIRPDDALAVVTGDDLTPDAAAAAIEVLTSRRVLRIDADRLVIGDALAEVIRSWPPPDDVEAERWAERYVDRFAAVAERFEHAGSTVPVSWLADDLADVLGAAAEGRRLGAPGVYRLIRALGPRWHELGRWADLAATSDWLATRPPTDGELDWVAAVSRVSFALTGDRAAPVHDLRDEAAAIALLDHDPVSTHFLSFRPAMQALDDGDPGPADELFDRAAADGVDAVAIAVATRLRRVVGRPEREAYLAARVDPDTYRDPIAAMAADLDPDRCDDGSR